MSLMVGTRLTEKSLAEALKQITGQNWEGIQTKLPGSRRRFDMAFWANDSLVLVEYDGDEHYRSSLKAKDDIEKDDLAASHGAKLVRIPYWVQLDDETAHFYFGLKARVTTSFPHGFITTKYFPASFCELGMQRFQRELETLPTGVRLAVVESLRARVTEHGLQFVLPTPLRGVIEPR
jgi:hypothetical protein